MNQQHNGNAVQAKKPAGEDLSRWENEGGQPSMSATHSKEKRSARDLLSGDALQHVLQNAPVSLQQLRGRLEEEVRQRPLAVLGAALAIGFVLGGGLRTRSGRKMLQRALAYGLDNLDKLKA